MMFPRFTKTALIGLVAAGITACGGDGAMTPQGAALKPALSKQASSSQAVARITLMNGGSPVPGATVELSRSVAGRAADYAWSATTGTDGTATIQVNDANGATGMYIARAADANSAVIGRWHSIPLNGGIETEITLSVGSRAELGQLSLIGDGPTMFTVRIENISRANEFPKAGSFSVPVGGSSPGPITPGTAYEFEFTAPAGSNLSFAAMFGPSNDFFFAPAPEGIPLWDNGNQISGDVTAQVMLWDAGTEINQEPGLGADQVQRQAAPNTGALDVDNTVRLAPDTFGNLPAVSDVLAVTVTPTSTTGFRVRIENTSTTSTLSTSDGNTQMVPVSPGVWVVHHGAGPLFTPGEPDRGEGLEGIAEDASFGALAANLAGRSGVNVPLSPGVWVVHSSSSPLFTEGQPDFAQGLEHIAEDGNVTDLAAAVSGNSAFGANGVFSVPVGASAAGPAFSGGAFTFTFSAEPGDRLSFATMFGTSNDWYFGPGDTGLPLFAASGLPVQGNVTAYVGLWDAGTEVTQEPGIGPDTGPQQSAPNTGAADPDNTVRPVDGAYDIPAVRHLIRVTVSAQ